MMDEKERRAILHFVGLVCDQSENGHVYGMCLATELAQWMGKTADETSDIIRTMPEIMPEVMYSGRVGRLAYRLGDETFLMFRANMYLNDYREYAQKVLKEILLESD